MKKITAAQVVAKSNRLVEASYRLTLTEQRIILFAICRFREANLVLTPETPVVITADAFVKQFPTVEPRSAYLQLKEAMDTLYKRSVKIYEKDPDTELMEVTETRWIYETSYVDGAGTVKIYFTPRVIKHITRLEGSLTSYNLDRVSGMTSPYAIRLYELLAQQKDFGKRTLAVDLLRELLQIQPGEYKLTGDLKKWVIERSVDQINEHSDLKVTYKPVKTVRTITAFEFKMRNKAAAASFDEVAAAAAAKAERLAAGGKPRAADLEEA